MQTTTPITTELAETLARVFGLFSKMVTRRQALDPQAMTRTDFSLLGTLSHCGIESGLRISKVAETMGHDLSTVSRRVTHLETHGLIERLPDPSDGRASTVRLTSEGRQALLDERRERTGLLARVLTDWPQSDLEDLDRLLTRLSTDLAADALSATHPTSPLQPTGRTAS